MTYKVYHANDVAFRDLSFKPKMEDVRAHLTAGNYNAVAVVDADALDDVYRLTQNINDAWVKNPEVVATTTASKRSTSVGDLIEAPDGKLWLVAGFGFDPVSGDAVTIKVPA